MLVLYDLKSTLKPQAWSPNVWKVRFALNYKKIPYRTEWISYPDIEDLWRRNNIPPSNVPGRPRYTIPALGLESGELIVESLRIARYLDEKYPETPRVLPKGSIPLQSAFVGYLRYNVTMPMVPLIVQTVAERLDEPGAAFFRQSREGWLGCKLENASPPGPKRDEHMVKLKSGFDMIDAVLAENGNGPWVMDDTVSFADFVLASVLIMLKRMGPADVWEDVSKWHGGRWERSITNCDEWSQSE